LAAVAAQSSALADPEDAEALFRIGKYDECVQQAEKEIGSGGWNERIRALKASAELVQGKYVDAMASVEDAVRRFPMSVSLRLIALEVYRYNGRLEEAARELDLLERVVMGSPQRFAAPEGRVALGRFFLLKGADARKVLDLFYDVAIK
jgi:hypothetical protein